MDKGISNASLSCLLSLHPALGSDLRAGSCCVFERLSYSGCLALLASAYAVRILEFAASCRVFFYVNVTFTQRK